METDYTTDKLQRFLLQYHVISLESSFGVGDKCECELRLKGEDLLKLVADTEFATISNGFKVVDTSTIGRVAVVTVDLTSIDRDGVNWLYKYVSKLLGDIPFILMPIQANLITMSSRELKEIRERIDDYIKASEFDSFVELSKKEKK